MKKQKMLVICIFVVLVIILIFILLFNKKTSLKKITNRLNSTNSVVIKNLKTDNKSKCQINDKKTINKITNIFQNVYEDTTKWENLPKNKYEIDFLNDSNKIIVTAIISTSQSNSIHLKDKNTEYIVKLPDIKTLNNIINKCMN